MSLLLDFVLWQKLFPSVFQRSNLPNYQFVVQLLYNHFTIHGSHCLPSACIVRNSPIPKLTTVWEKPQLETSRWSWKSCGLSGLCLQMHRYPACSGYYNSADLPVGVLPVLTWPDLLCSVFPQPSGLGPAVGFPAGSTVSHSSSFFSPLPFSFLPFSHSAILPSPQLLAHFLPVKFSSFQTHRSTSELSSDS